MNTDAGLQPENYLYYYSGRLLRHEMDNMSVVNRKRCDHVAVRASIWHKDIKAKLYFTDICMHYVQGMMKSIK